MSWKTQLQVRDLEPKQKLEITCVKCNHSHYITPEQIMCSPEREYLYLDEVEKQIICKARGCYGHVRMVLIRPQGTSAFIGGLA